LPKTAPAIVTIIGQEADGSKSIGSGFLIDASGTIVTNVHIIAGLQGVTVQLPNGDTFDRVTVRAFDEPKDIAIIQVPAFAAPTVPLGNSDIVRQGDNILLMGTPLGLRGTVSSGLVSAIRLMPGYRVFHTDATASPGNSGGPMLDLNSEVVGVLTFKFEGGENLNLSFRLITFVGFCR
jgi:serine protease Do